MIISERRRSIVDSTQAHSVVFRNAPNSFWLLSEIAPASPSRSPFYSPRSGRATDRGRAIKAAWRGARSGASCQSGSQSSLSAVRLCDHCQTVHPHNARTAIMINHSSPVEPNRLNTRKPGNVRRRSRRRCRIACFAAWSIDEFLDPASNHHSPPIMPSRAARSSARSGGRYGASSSLGARTFPIWF